MFLPSALVARTSDEASPPSCKPFTIHSNVCVGDLVAIIACSIAGIGFFFWAIHAVRKMRQFPFTYKESEANDEPIKEGEEPLPVPPTFDQSDRVRARLALSQPASGEEFYKQSTSIPVDPYYEQYSVTVPRPPPPARGQSRRSLSYSMHHGSLARGGPSGGRYEDGMNDDCDIRNVSPSHAMGSPLHGSGSGYGSRRYMGHMHGDPATNYGY